MLVEVVHGHDGGMLQLGDDARFALKAREEVGVLLERRMQHLDRHEAIEAGVIGLEDRRHAAATQLFDDLIWPDVFTFGKTHRAPPE